MSKGFLRGLSFGIILTTTILSYFLYTSVTEKETSDFTISSEEVTQFLEQSGQTSITVEEYTRLTEASNELEQVKLDLENLKNQSSAHAQNEENMTEDTQVEPNEILSYTLEIKSGMATTQVSKRLEEVKIINSATQFEEYLKKRNWEGSVQIGTFHVNNKMTVEEIAAMITGH
ncbi:hypothetical protein ACFSCX_08250 [Bacillus salitolerans]|uniref:Endolytic transglycosylase MltG n=1 Tax=Bacillus salitolerans TaxID=1437434 RepID=A0ABW4LQZ1_9BACI